MSYTEIWWQHQFSRWRLTMLDHFLLQKLSFESFFFQVVVVVSFVLATFSKWLYRPTFLAIVNLCFLFFGILLSWVFLTNHMLHNKTYTRDYFNSFASTCCMIDLRIKSAKHAWKICWGIVRRMNTGSRYLFGWRSKSPCVCLMGVKQFNITWLVE